MTSDSIRTRPRINAPRMSPDALGLRAMASAADPIARPWPSAPRPAAIPSAKPAVKIDAIGTVNPPPVVGLAVSAPCCAESGATNTSTTSIPIHANKVRLLTLCPPWPGDFVPPDPLTRSHAGTPRSPLRSRGLLATLVRSSHLVQLRWRQTRIRAVHRMRALITMLDVMLDRDRAL